MNTNDSTRKPAFDAVTRGDNEGNTMFQMAEYHLFMLKHRTSEKGLMGAAKRTARDFMYDTHGHFLRNSNPKGHAVCFALVAVDVAARRAGFSDD